MYLIEWTRIFSRSGRVDPAPASGEGTGAVETSRRFKWLPAVSGTVWALGWTSLLTDISSEMVASILPIYLVGQLGLAPFAFGVVDGLQRGAAALVLLAGGVLADRWRRHKEVAALGYGLSAACRLLILFASNVAGMISTVVTLDRIGKGVRTAPRDALISLRSSPAMLGTAFGVHRAMDAVGALLGPVFAFVLLKILPGRFDVLFVASFGVAIMGLGAILFFVPGMKPAERARPGTVVSFTAALRLMRDGKFRSLVIAGTLLGVTTISDSFIFLTLQRQQELVFTVFPLLFVGAALFTSVCAIPFGRLADRVGRKAVFLGGYGILAMIYAVLLLPFGKSSWLLLAVLFGMGIFYAATDGVLSAMASAILPPAQVGSGLAVLATATGLARLAGSMIFGLLWARAGMNQATVYYLVALVPVLVAAGFILNRSRQNA
jgi:MFS family permease